MSRTFHLSVQTSRVIGWKPRGGDLKPLRLQWYAFLSIFDRMYRRAHYLRSCHQWPLEQNYSVTPGSGGQLISGWEAKIIKEDGTLGGYDELGELVLRGPSVALRYEGNPAA